MGVQQAEKTFSIKAPQLCKYLSPSPSLCGKYPEFVVNICLSALEVQSETGAQLFQALDKVADFCWGEPC